MTVFLLVLKIIGFVLLGIIGLFILAVCVVLSIPARYSADIDTDREEEKLKYDPSWVVQLIFSLMNPEGNLLAVLKSMIRDDGILGDKNLYEAIKHVLPELVRLIRYLLPKDIKGTGSFGLESPDKTGIATGVLSVVWPVHEEFTLTPNFTEETLELKCALKGRYFLWVVLYDALRIIRHKDVRYIIGKFLKAMGRKEQYGQEQQY